MTDYYPFTPSSVRAPSFSPTFDNDQYKLTITWNISGQRFYVNCVDMNGNLIYSIPVIESVPPSELEDLSWDLFNGIVVGTTVAPHGIKPGTVMLINIIGARPITYNGTGFINVLNERQFSYPMARDPGSLAYAGVVEYIISMNKAYFGSTLVYRQKIFEVAP